jgi:hypothetical protein
MVREVQLAQLGQWVLEVLLVHLDHLDLLDILLLENLEQLASLGQWDQEERLDQRDILVFLVFLVWKEREALEFQGFKDHQAQLDQWAQLVCQANLELVNLVPMAILESLARVDSQEEMVLLGQMACPGQRVTQGLQAQEHLGNQARMVPQVHMDQQGLKVHRVLLVSQAPLACQALAKQVNLESQVAEDLPVLLEPLVKKESQAQLVLLVLQVVLVLLAQLVHRVQEDSRVREAQSAPRATLVW